MAKIPYRHVLEPGQAIPTDARIEVYWNLHLRCYSVRALEGADKGRVIAHAGALALRDVTFRVGEAGRQRVLRERRKNVHAFVRGVVIPFKADPTRYDSRRPLDVGYNPYKTGHFHVIGHESQPIVGALEIFLDATHKDGEPYPRPRMTAFGPEFLTQETAR
jgi:hypothetical protein